MYSFCFWFSVRLGSIIVGAICLVQSLVLLVLTCMATKDVEGFKANVDYWLEFYELLGTKDIFMRIRNDPEPYLNGLLAFAIISSVTCILLMYGSYKCTLSMTYPFIVVEFARLIFLSVVFVIAMMVVKENVPNLGLIIGYSIVGGFLLLFIFYLWYCPVSLVKLVRELERQGKLLEVLGEEEIELEFPAISTKPLSVISLGQYRLNHYPIQLTRPIY